MHRAVTLDGRAVAVKVQYPGIAETIAADLRNVALLRRMLRITAPAQDVDALLTELRDRVVEELDYRREAANQRLLAAYYDGHPTIHVPGIISELSTRRMVTSELSGGARFAELASWPQDERDLAAETIYRFVFRSLYEVRAFNGDPHPGNYLFHRGGRVTFLDFGLVKHFTPAELQPLLQMARNVCVEHDPEAFRRSLENAGFLRPGAPLSTQAIVEHLAVFYDTIREPGPLTITSDYASSVVRRFFDVRSPVADYISVPRSYVILQRINLGLFAVLGELSATANWRAIAEEIWPFTHGPASTPMGEAEAAWRARRQPIAAWPACRGGGRDTWPWSRRLADSASEGDAHDRDDARHSAHTRWATAVGRRQLAGRSGTLACVVCRAGRRLAGARTPAADRRGADHGADRGFNGAAGRQDERGQHRVTGAGPAAGGARLPGCRDLPGDQLPVRAAGLGPGWMAGRRPPAGQGH